MPKSVLKLREYFLDLYKKPLLLKPSINNHLIEKDVNLFDKMEAIADAIQSIKDGFKLCFNVRKRGDQDQWIVDELEKRNLLDVSNVFYFQKYGRASNKEDFEAPFIINNPVEFYLISPDGEVFPSSSPNCLVERSEHMKNLI